MSRSDDARTVRTGSNAAAAIRFDDGVIKLNANTLLELPGAPTPVLVRLPAGDAGAVRFFAKAISFPIQRGAAVDPNEIEFEGPVPDRLILRAGEVWVSVLPGRSVTAETRAADRVLASAATDRQGAEIDLKLGADRASTLTVGQGRADFSAGSERVSVPSSHQVRAEPGRPLEPPVRVELSTVLEWTNDVQPVAPVLEILFVSQDPAKRDAEEAAAKALPPGATRSRRLGDVLHDRGDLQAALLEYDAALAALPPDTPAAERAAILARVGQTRLEMGTLERAKPAFEESLRLDPNSTTARAGLVLTLLGDGDTERALAEARVAVERDGRSPLAHTALGLARIRAGRREEARRSLEQALALGPEYAPAHAWLSFLQRAEERLEEAETSARRAVAAAPFSSLARQSLADALFARRRFRDARSEAERAVALNPRSPGARVSLGRVRLQEGDVGGALQSAREAVSIDPGLARAQFFLGYVLWQQRRLGPAAAALEEAIRLDPEHLEARAYLARTYLEQGRRSAAVEVARQAVPRDPDFAPVRAALGRVNWYAGRLRPAIEEYRRAVALAPRSALYHLELAQVLLDANDLPGALDHALLAVNDAPGSGETHAVLGLVYDRMENREQALRAYRAALALSPDNALARLGLGTSFPRSGERQAEIRRVLTGAVPDSDSRTLQRLASTLDPVDGLQEVAQGILRDPAVLGRIFEPGVTTEIAPRVGRHELRALGLTHRDRYFEGALHDLTFGNREEVENYRNAVTERRTLAWLNLAAAPSFRTHLLGQYAYSDSKTAPPGATDNPLRSARGAFWDNVWDLSARHQATSRTAAWLRLNRQVTHLRDDNPNASPPNDVTLFSRARLSQIGIDGRIDHRWDRRGDQMTTYVLFAGRERFDSRDRSFDERTRQFETVDLFGEGSLVSHTLQQEYRGLPRLTLLGGVTQERFAEEHRRRPEGGSTRTVRSAAETDWLPFGQATYLLSQRDLVRLIAHTRRHHLLGALLRPTEAFLIVEPPSLALGGRSTNYELDYEYRFSPRRFAKLFLFRSDADDYFVTPAVRQTPELLGFFISESRSEGFGLRVEEQIGRFLSGFARYTYREVTDETPGPTRGRQLPMNPRSRLLVGFNYVDRAGTKLYLEGDWRSALFSDRFWQGDLAFDPAAPRPRFGSRMLVNLRLGQERSVRGEWVLSVHNVFNTATIYWPGFPAPGRTYELQYRARF